MFARIGCKTSNNLYLAGIQYVTHAGQAGETHTNQGVERVHLIHIVGSHDVG